MKIGRNDPCYCGSGKKYKKCHLSYDVKRAKEERSLGNRYEWLAYHVRRLGQTLNLSGLEESAWPIPEEPRADAAFLQHLLLDSNTKLEELSPLDPHDISADRLKALFEVLPESVASVLEVKEVKRLKGVRLLDRLTGEEPFVSDLSLVSLLEPMEMIIGRLVRFEKKNVLLPDFEKIRFRGRKAALSRCESLMAEALGTPPEFPEVSEGDEEAKQAVAEQKKAWLETQRAWLKQNAAHLYTILRQA